jgi:hypothetical protein
VITVEQYFIRRPHSVEQNDSAVELLARVNALLASYQIETGNELDINPHTGNLISGETNGGFRLPDCPIGAANSSHKQAQAVDVHDDGKLDAWVTDAILEKFNLYREHPDYTIGWCHLSTRAPGSGHRTFIP